MEIYLLEKTDNTDIKGDDHERDSSWVTQPKRQDIFWLVATDSEIFNLTQSVLVDMVTKI